MAANGVVLPPTLLRPADEQRRRDVRRPRASAASGERPAVATRSFALRARRPRRCSSGSRPARTPASSSAASTRRPIRAFRLSVVTTRRARARRGSRRTAFPCSGLDGRSTSARSTSVVLAIDRSRSMAGQSIADAARSRGRVRHDEAAGDAIGVVAFGSHASAAHAVLDVDDRRRRRPAHALRRHALRHRALRRDRARGATSSRCAQSAAAC